MQEIIGRYTHWQNASSTGAGWEPLPVAGLSRSACLMNSNGCANLDFWMFNLFKLMIFNENICIDLDFYGNFGWG
ncbi:hypothetical protein ABHF33_08110 [Chitinibacter sp. FCG-7]|uniref:Uncharacterized protein n=1 Tax=Chitinibacter mangrovi TaxID=3153927 RepID=A0AAU7FDU8_9NEIS